MQKRSNFRYKMLGFSVRSCVDEAHGVERDFADERVVGHHHGNSSEQDFQVVWQFSATRVTRVHGDEHCAGWIKRQLSAFEHEPKRKNMEPSKTAKQEEM